MTSSMISSVPAPIRFRRMSPPDALDAVLAHVARAAVDLDAFVRHFAGDPRGVELGHERSRGRGTRRC